VALAKRKACFFDRLRERQPASFAAPHRKDELEANTQQQGTYARKRNRELRHHRQHVLGGPGQHHGQHRLLLLSSL
jgi:hypothetical protein